MSWICPECEHENDDLARCICGYEIRDKKLVSQGYSVDYDKKPDQIVRTSYRPNEIAAILQEEIYNIPFGLQNINLFDFGGTSQVCGTVNECGFELRNRRHPPFSLRAYGKFYPSKKGSIIKINYKKPKSLDIIWAFILRRYQSDKKVIIDFLKECLKIEEYTEPTSSHGLDG